MARRKQEAYHEIDQSDDEVFQTYLYDWYLQQGWSDRLLEIESPHVVTYLKRKSNDDAAHADLLWRYYARYNNYFEAAKVQLQLAKSGFDINLSTRIGHLSRAKANTSTRTNGLQDFSKTPQTKQEVVREITDLLDLANIQEDLLHRLGADSRITDDRRPEIVKELDGKILALDTVSLVPNSKNRLPGVLVGSITFQFTSLTPASYITNMRTRLAITICASSSTKWPTTAIAQTSGPRGSTWWQA